MPQKRTESIYGIFTLSTSRFNFTPSGGHEPPKTFVINDHSVQRRQLEYYFYYSLYSSYQIYPYGGQLRRILMSITDYRDNGKLVLTPIYLVFGLSAPIWFDLMRFGEIKLSSFAGLASVGIGDSFASIVGKKYGRSRIFRDGKSVEGKRFKKIREYQIDIQNENF